MNTTKIALYQELRNEIPEKAAIHLIEYIDETIRHEISMAVERKNKHLPTQEEMAKQISNLHVKLADQYMI